MDVIAPEPGYAFRHRGRGIFTHLVLFLMALLSAAMPRLTTEALKE